MQFDTCSLWLYLYFPQLQLDLLETSAASTQALKQKPRAIIDTSSNRLCQLNHNAIAEGVCLGAGLAHASLLCNNLELHEYNSELESQHIINIANDLYLVSADIVLLPPNALALRAQNMLHLYGGLQGYWQVIVNALKQQQVNYIAASAYSVQAAKLLALNKISLVTDKRKNIAEALAQCALNVSDIEAKDLKKLARIGVKNYAELLQLPSDGIANRVSRFSMGIINELQGKQAAKLCFYQPKANYRDYIELLYEISLSDKLLPVIKHLLDKLETFLLLRDSRCLQIAIGFFQREHDQQHHSFSSIRPIYRCQDWLEIIALKLERICFESPVYGLSLCCDKYEVCVQANDDMFAQKSSHVAALSLLSRLQSKLGSKYVQTLSFVPDFRPEHSTQFNQQISNTAPKQHNHQSSVLADRPGLLLPTPEPLDLTVEVIDGPERIQTGWWDNQPIERDYYIAQHPNGQQLWIFKTPQQQWFVHGFFV